MYHLSWWSERLLESAMEQPEFKAQLFRFVDVFPALDGDDDVARHLEEYMGGAGAPRALGLGVGAADHVPFGHRIEARVAERNIRRMAEQFILGSSTDEVVAGVGRLWAAGTATTVDLLGEKTVVEADADRYRGPRPRDPRRPVRRRRGLDRRPAPGGRRPRCPAHGSTSA